jgi:hypothetical protein
LPYKALQVGDLRCNRVTYGLWAGDRYVPLLDDTDPRDLRARDVFLSRLPGNLLFAPPLIAAARVGRAMLMNPGDVPPVVSWALRLVRRLGVRALGGDLHPTTYVMHSFMDAADVAPSVGPPAARRPRHGSEAAGDAGAAAGLRLRHGAPGAR